MTSISIQMSFILLLALSVLETNSKALTKASNATYWIERDALIQQDLDQMLGHDIILSPEEEAVNSILMASKNLEMDNAFQTLEFSPSKNFIEAKTTIDTSEVFNFIKTMPKGAVLHAHDMAMASIEWVISDLTYWDDLYMCNGTGNVLLFRFFIAPDTTCQWKLVSEERQSYSSVQEFDAYLFSKLSLYTTDVQNAYPDINSIWSAFENIFITIGGLVTYSEAWRSYLGRALQEFMDDNITYLEFRGVLPLLYDKDGRNYTEEETFQVYSDVIQNFTSINVNKFFGARFIYAPPRSVDVQTVWSYVDIVIRLTEMFPTIVAGFDLVGQEDLGQPLIAFIDPILSLKEHDPPIPVFFHAGETDWEGMSSDENMYDAFLLNSTRVGHGYAISKHPQLIQMARDKDIPIEVCPISNQVLKLVEDLRNHPAASLAASSFPLVISSDDPAIWEALPLSHDFYEAFMGIGGAKADLRFLKKLALNSIKYSSLDPVDKIILQTKWENQWNDFIFSFLLNIRLSEAEETNKIPALPHESNKLLSVYEIREINN